jgi:predicted N-acetyltransferase YhbS
MQASLRPGALDDAPAVGRIAHDAFKSIADQHSFPPDLPSREIATGLVSMLLGHPRFYSVVAEIDGRIIGSNFLDERSSIAGVGPITVDPAVQNRRIGRSLMDNVLARSTKQRFAGVRLVQVAYHNRSLCLYTELGFRTREPLSLMQGTPPKAKLAGYEARRATAKDIEACNDLCRRVHGHDRGGDLTDAIQQNTATVIERNGRVTAYATQIAFFGHAVGETNEDVMALIRAAQGFPGPGFLVPTRNHELLSWCLDKGLRLVYQATLMSIGLYNEPIGAYLPSIFY